MIDGIHDCVGNIPVSSPKVAGYTTGSSDIEWTTADWGRFPNSGHVRIDQSSALASWGSGGADVADVESGAGTIGTAVAEALERKAKGWLSFVYISEGNFAAMQSAMNAAGLEGHTQYWVADWSLSEAEAAAKLTGDVVAVQWASPTSNPDTVVPDGTQTLAQANLDLSVTVPSWFQKIPPAPQKTGLVVTSGYKTYPVTSYDSQTWLVA